MLCNCCVILEIHFHDIEYYSMHVVDAVIGWPAAAVPLRPVSAACHGLANMQLNCYALLNSEIDVGLISEVAPRRARSVLGWVTVSVFNSLCWEFTSV